MHIGLLRLGMARILQHRRPCETDVEQAVGIAIRSRDDILLGNTGCAIIVPRVGGEAVIAGT
ncbi:MAG: hypothetical protein B7Z62_04020 [Deltaproteobacteria bacterium 37-65-8]|nr:MAG: hypothetical protein B7Z62_04020 [Deltaproteobacteria bacterium 37-65-8]